MLLLRTRSLAFALLVAPAALAGPPPKPTPHRLVPAHQAGARSHFTTAKLEAAPHRAASGRSVGSPTEGHLIGGAHLAEGPHLRIVPDYAAGDARWGLEPLVALVDHAARAVRKQYPDSVASVGHLSRPGGGEIDRHASHESGRDADIGFYVRNEQGKPIFADHFVSFRPDGTAATWPGARFDDARNWAFVAAIATDASAHVTHIFVALPLRTRLLQYAEKTGVAPAVRTRAAELMAQPRGALPHDDHFHVRIGCPPGMEKCIEQPLARRPAPHAGGTLARSHTSTSSKVRATPHPPGHGSAPPAPRPAERDEPEASKTEAFVPSLAPMVQGLDSVVIPAPLAGTKPAPPETPPPAERSIEPDLAPIDDPDGVLEKH